MAYPDTIPPNNNSSTTPMAGGSSDHALAHNQISTFLTNLAVAGTGS